MLLMHNHTVCNPNKLPPDFDGISAHMKLYKRSGVDEITSWTVGWNGEDWPNGGAVAHLTAAMTVKMSKRYSVLVQMEKADIEIACECRLTLCCGTRGKAEGEEHATLTQSPPTDPNPTRSFIIPIPKTSMSLSPKQSKSPSLMV